MPKIQSWEVSDAFWKRACKLLPKRKREADKKYKRKKGGGRKPIEPRKVFEGIVYVLRTGIQWKAIDKERFGAGSSIHQYFQEWTEDGFFLRLWLAGLCEYDEMEGIAWKWQSADGSMNKAPLAQESVGKNPTDRGKKRDKEKCIGGRAWNPVIDRRMRS